MQVVFSKYQGAGNDFIIIDDRTCFFPIDQQLISHLCHRMYGIGGDGLILLQISDIADFRMRIFNSDGVEAAMCGNGLRCLGHYLQEQMLCRGVFSIETGAGIMQIDSQGAHVATHFQKISASLRHYTLHGFCVFVVDTGVPHGVIFVDDVQGVDVPIFGKAVRSDPLFAPFGINVSFVEKVDKKTLKIRTYERGVEKETLACGTAAVAAGLVLFLQKKWEGSLTIFPTSLEKMTLCFSMDKDCKPFAILRGPSCRVFSGSIDLRDVKKAL